MIDLSMTTCDQNETGQGRRASSLWLLTLAIGYALVICKTYQDHHEYAYCVLTTAELARMAALPFKRFDVESFNHTTRNTSAQYTNLHGDARTAFISLTARAWDARSPSPILNDESASSVLEALRSNGHDVSSSQMPPTECQSIAIRTRQFDRWTSAFLDKHDDALVLHLGCGLDARAARLHWGPAVQWADVDLHEVVALRKQLDVLSMDNSGYRLLGADVTQVDWLEEYEIPKDKPTIVVMEGLLSYLTEEQSRNLIRSLIKHFSRVEICFDCISSTVLNATKRGQVKSIKDVNAELRSAIDDMDAWKARLGVSCEILEVVRFFEAEGVQRLPLMTRLQLYVSSWIPGLRDSARLVRMGSEK